MPDDFPTFYFDSNGAFGMIDEVSRWEWLVETVTTALEESPSGGQVAKGLSEGLTMRECAIEWALDSTNMVGPEKRSWASTPNAPGVKLGQAIEKWGQVANFGYRREHIGGDVTLREWLRAKGWLDRLTKTEEEQIQ